jgi:hypothetical protein
MSEPTIMYKPGWTFEWEGVCSPPDPCYLLVRKVGPDSDNPTAVHDATYRFEFPDGLDVPLLMNRLHGLEYHELCEWLRVDGVKVADPHRRDTEFILDAHRCGCALCGAALGEKPE